MNTIKLLSKRILSATVWIPKFKIDFTVDRLSRLYTVNLIVLLTSLLTTKQFIQQPINCWIPKELQRYSSYMQKLCWLKGTYYLPLDSYGNVIEETPSNEYKKESLITYYQWISIILLLQAFGFYAPYLLWSFLSNKCGFDVYSMIDACKKYNSHDKNRILNFLKTNFIRQQTYYQLNRSHDCIYTSIKSSLSKIEWKKSLKKCFPINYFLYLSYIICKLVYFLNTICQLYFINLFLSSSTNSLSIIGILKSLLNGTHTNETQVFPRLVQCDMNIREQHSTDNQHFYTIKCILSLNLFTEKIYLILYIWCTFVALVTFYDLIKWIFNFSNCSSSYKFIKNRLRARKEDKRLLFIFSNMCLGHDGIFMLKLIESNGSILLACDIIESLLDDYKKNILL